ncbi:MAG: glycosyltransferase family 2 protein [Candidatus Marithrix sp.]
MKNNISVIILTFNEEIHIERCIKSVQPFAKEIFIVDSCSEDKTVEIAKSLGAKIYQNPWPGNHAEQFNWGLKYCPIETEWVMRMDADEYVLPELANEIKDKLYSLDENITAIYMKRRVYFLDRWIKYGGYYPLWFLRIWRNNKGYCVQRWMDEYIEVSDGESINFKNDFVDENISGLTSWTNKHNSYATKEVIDILNITHNFSGQNIANSVGKSVVFKSWLKQIYNDLPLFIRPFIYFHYRYFFKLGFLDGKPGLIWHFLQGFWYRFYIDAKIYEIHHNVGNDKNAILKFIKEKYGISL